MDWVWSVIIAGSKWMCEGIAKELEGIELGDKRLNKRSARVIELLAANPEASVNAACGKWDDTLAAYRLFNNPAVEPAKILQPHLEATRRRMQEHPVVLVLQDTTELDFTAHPAADAECLNREERRLRATIGKVERERGDKSEPENLERLGNTVLANLNRITKGMTSVTLTDPYGAGEIEVELDAALDGPANARRFFKRAKKLRSASKLAEERFSSLRNRLEKITTERDKVANIDDISDLKKIATKYVKIKASARDADDEEKFPRRYKSVSGLDIIVGRNDRENDELVRWARKNDFWLHAQNIGGSHVILRAPGKQPPDRKSIELAATIAAYFSKAKNSAVVPVACTQVKYVVKRRGQGPGKVTYTREKVIFAQPGVPGTQP